MSIATLTLPLMLPPGSPADKVPPAPPGTIFVLGPEGGYAVPPRKHTLLFGRDREEVHVAVGMDDPAVSRRHGMFTCAGPHGEWWLRNTGSLPIELPDGTLMLTGHCRVVKPGYTTLVINSSAQRSHLLEVRLIDEADHGPRGTTKARTISPETGYELTPDERLVIAALAKCYLEGHEHCPQPLTWQDTARIADSSPHANRSWNAKTTANTVEAVRNRLHSRGIPGLVRAEIGTNVGATLSANLIKELLRTGTLSSRDLDLLGDCD